MYFTATPFKVLPPPSHHHQSPCILPESKPTLITTSSSPDTLSSLSSSFHIAYQRAFSSLLSVLDARSEEPNLPRLSLFAAIHHPSEPHDSRRRASSTHSRPLQPLGLAIADQHNVYAPPVARRYTPSPLDFVPLSARLIRASQPATMPYRLDTHVLTVDANVIHKVDTANPANLFSMWTGRSPTLASYPVRR